MADGREAWPRPGPAAPLLEVIDLGLDVAWDTLIGTALVFSGFAIRSRNGLGPGSTIPSVHLGVALIGLNGATFPWPGDRGPSTSDR